MINYILLSTAEVERREKALLEELEIIESQVNSNKPQQQTDELPNEQETTEEPQPMEEGVENRDPNPEPQVEQTLTIENSETSSPKIETVEKSEVQLEEVVTENDIQEKNQTEEIENHG